MTLHDTALRYAELDLSVIPLVPKDKRPLLSSWAAYQHRRATAKEIDSWFEKWPNANVGIVCGAVSGGLAVIDVDGSDNPWPGPAGELPMGAAVSQTGGGGRQYFLRIPDGVDLGNSVGKLAPKVDIRGNGGYVVAPPSIHPLTGQAYQWAVPLDGPVADLPEIPAWVVQALQETRAKASRSDDTEFEQLLTGVDEGARNDAAARLAGHYFAKGLTRGEVDMMLATWNANNRPPMPEKELAAVIDSIGKRQLLKEQNAVPASEEDITDEQRQVWLEEVSEAIGIPITAIHRIEGDDPQVEMHTTDHKVSMPLDKLASYAEFTKAMMRAANRVPQVKQKEYRGVLAKLLAAAKRVSGTDEATLKGQLVGWLEAYLESRAPAEAGEGVAFDSPLLREDGLWIVPRKFYQYCARAFNYREDGRRFSQELTRFGFAEKVIKVRLCTGQGKAVRMRRVPGEFVISPKSEDEAP